LSSDPNRPPGALPRAVALRYDGRARGAHEEVPRVVARGQGRVAEAILELARAHAVPVREDPDLVALLATCETGEEIPTELYTAVAELLVWLYQTNARLGGRADGAARS